MTGKSPKRTMKMPWFPNDDVAPNDCFESLRKLATKRIVTDASSVVAELEVIVVACDIRDAYFKFLQTHFREISSETLQANVLASVTGKGLGVLAPETLFWLSRSPNAINGVTESLLNTIPISKHWLPLFELAGARQKVLEPAT